METTRFLNWIARMLAAGDWPPDASEIRRLGDEPVSARWPLSLAKRLTKKFASRPAVRVLQGFLLNDKRLWRALHKRPLTRRLPAPSMSPIHPRLARLHLPPCGVPGELADLLQLSGEELQRLVRRLSWRPSPLEAGREYRNQLVATRPGRARLIESPKARLKAVQRRILRRILDQAPPHDAAHGFRQGRNLLSFIKPHVGRELVLRMDLQDCFASIQSVRVRAVFRALGYPDDVAYILTLLTTTRTPIEFWDSVDLPFAARRQLRETFAASHLPQGAPTSPALANLCLYRLDVRLSRLAQSCGASYTRYADDLAMSGGRSFARRAARIRDHVGATILEEGLRVNFRKTRIMRAGGRQRLAGVVVNQVPNVTRTEFDRLKATLHNCVRHGPETQNRARHPSFRAHLRGRIAFVASLHPGRGEKLRREFDRIDWSRSESTNPRDDHSDH